MIRVKMVKNIFPIDLNDDQLVERINFSDRLELASAMFDAYEASPDYEEDSLEDFENEINHLETSLYGPVISEASLCIKKGKIILAGIFVCDFKGEATITYTFTRKEYQGQGLAERLIRRAENTLYQLGYKELYLYLTLENHDGFALFDTLGFEETSMDSKIVDLNEFQ